MVRVGRERVLGHGQITSFHNRPTLGLLHNFGYAIPEIQKPNNRRARLQVRE